nr:hypothetical protein [Sedimentibacter sp.]
MNKIEEIEKILNEREELKDLMQSILNIEDKEEQTFAIRNATVTLNRIQLFNTVKDTIYGIADVHIEDERGEIIGVGCNIMDSNFTNENVSFVHMVDDTMEVHINNESVLKIYKTSPILEAFKELFEQIQENHK